MWYILELNYWTGCNIKMIIDAVTVACPDLTVQGADVSKNGSTYSFSATPNSDEVFIFALDNISVVEVTE